ncbi:TPA: hypothetical protein ACH3X1_011003 [Trebouxia sp. C0004]
MSNWPTHAGSQVHWHRFAGWSERMATVQQRTHQSLEQTSSELFRHTSASDKRLHLFSKDCEARRGQLVLIQQDLLYITETLRRLQRLCDLQNSQKSDDLPESA